MATNFPASLDTLTNPSATDTLDSPPHDEQHADANDAIEALQAKVGVDSSAVTSSLDYRVGQLETGGGGMTVSSTAPSSPAEGDMWYDDTSGRTYVYYDDGSSQQWVEFGAPPSGIGKILQVVSTTKTDTFSASVAAGASTAVTGLTATITPSSTGSKIFVIANVVGATSDGPHGYAVFNLKRDATAIAQPASPGSRIPITTYNLSISGATVMQGGSAHHLDSPATTSSTTYSVDLVNTSGSTATLYVNRADSDTDASTRRRTVSTITVMEVSA